MEEQNSDSQNIDKRHVFHWKMNGGNVEIMSVFMKTPDHKIAQRLARDLRYRGVNARVAAYQEVTVGECGFGKFTQSLRAVGIDWDEFKGWVSFLYFDGENHIPGKAAL